MILENNINIALFEIDLQNKGLAESTIANYASAVRSFIRTNPKLDDEKDFNKFLIRVMGKVNKRGTIYYAALKHYIKYIHNSQKAHTIISNLIKPQDRDPKTVRQYLNLKKRTEILNHLYELNEKHFIIALIQQQTGIRIGDVLRLEVGSINWEEHDDKKILRLDVIGKRQKRKSTYITNLEMANVVWNWIQRQGLDVKEEDILIFDADIPTHYFLDPIKRRKNAKHTLFHRVSATAKNYRYNLKLALKASKVDHTKFSTHDWRRCFSRDTYDKYNDIIILQNVLGHSNISTTSRYLRHSGLNTLKVLETMQN